MPSLDKAEAAPWLPPGLALRSGEGADDDVGLSPGRPILTILAGQIRLAGRGGAKAEGIPLPSAPPGPAIADVVVAEARRAV